MSWPAKLPAFYFRKTESEWENSDAGMGVCGGFSTPFSPPNPRVTIFSVAPSLPKRTRKRQPQRLTTSNHYTVTSSVVAVVVALSAWKIWSRDKFYGRAQQKHARSKISTRVRSGCTATVTNADQRKVTLNRRTANLPGTNSALPRNRTFLCSKNLYTAETTPNHSEATLSLVTKFQVKHAVNWIVVLRFLNLPSVPCHGQATW